MVISTNKRAHFDYEILETYEAGVQLKGYEVRAVRLGQINISGSYVIIRKNEAWLINVDIPPYQPQNTPSNYEQRRTRRLLLKKSEIKSLAGKLQEKGLTLLPLRVYTKNRNLKLLVGLGRARKKKDKRDLLKRREAEREMKTFQ